MFRVYGGSDYAVTDGGGDYTVRAVVGLDAPRRAHVCSICGAAAPLPTSGSRRSAISCSDEMSISR
jgi:hypothetical protein